MSLFNSFSHRMILYLLENFQIFLKNGVQSHIILSAIQILIQTRGLYIFWGHLH